MEEVLDVEEREEVEVEGFLTSQRRGKLVNVWWKGLKTGKREAEFIHWDVNELVIITDNIRKGYGDTLNVADGERNGH